MYKKVKVQLLGFPPESHTDFLKEVYHLHSRKATCTGNTVQLCNICMMEYYK